MTAINCYKFDIKGVPEQQIAGNLKVSKFGLPQANTLGEKMENS